MRPRPSSGPTSRDRAAHPLGERGGRVLVGARQEHDELLAADPGGDVDAAGLLLEQRAEPHQHPVAQLVAVRVVDVLEVVEVEDDGPSGVPSRAARAISACMRSSSPRRLRRPVSGSTRASSTSLSTSRSLRAASTRTTPATTSTATTTSIQRSIVLSGPDSESSTAPCTAPIQPTMKAVPPVPKKNAIQTAGHM